MIGDELAFCLGALEAMDAIGRKLVCPLLFSGMASEEIRKAEAILDQIAGSFADPYREATARETFEAYGTGDFWTGYLVGCAKLTALLMKINFEQACTADGFVDAMSSLQIAETEVLSGHYLALLGDSDD